ncbi:MAG: replication factor C large subunit [Nanoarchaeota archaeon]|nr:replication factor C large subunit [Nanoarchaeota archaeon]
MTEKFKNWVEKYRAKKFEEIKGQQLAISKLQNFFSNFPKGKKAIIFHGAPGTGKTSIAHVAANELDLEIFELNASDFRNKEQLESKLKPASEQKSLFKKGKILLVDEIDGLSARKDRGGLTELAELINSTQFPIILTANNIWDKKFSVLRKKTEIIALNELDYKITFQILKQITRNEKLTIDDQILISISVRSKGDVRAAINDLQTIAFEENALSTYMTIDERNKSQDIFTALKQIFKNMFTENTLRVYDNVDMPLEKIFLWLEENIAYEYSGNELFKAFEALSLADVFRGRIRKRRYWRFLVYQNIFLSAGVALAKTKSKTGFTQYQKPSRILKIWISNNKNKHKKTIVAKYARKIHCSKKKAIKEFNIIKPFLRKPQIQNELNLSEQEIEWLARVN